VIKSFRCVETRRFFEAGRSKRFSSIATAAARTLAMLDAVHTLEFLRSPPGNRLQALRADRKGQHNIRIDDQFRICFRWADDGPADVEIVDYH
jgi:proteic killer suppression protein